MDYTVLENSRFVILTLCILVEYLLPVPVLQWIAPELPVLQHYCCSTTRDGDKHDQYDHIQ